MILAQGAIKGKVTDKVTAKPLAHVQAIAVLKGSLIDSAYTDSAGSFIMKPVPAGFYSIKAAAPNHSYSGMDNVFVADNKMTYLAIEMMPLPKKKQHQHKKH